MATTGTWDVEAPLVHDGTHTNTALEPASYFTLGTVQASNEECNKMKTNDTDAPAEYDPTTYTKPYSPFYTHPCQRASVDGSKLGIKVEMRASQDLESGLAAKPSSSTLSRKEDDGVVKDWAGERLSFKERVRNKKRGLTWPKARRCNCLASLTKGQRLAVKLLIAVVIAGAMVGIALGISVAVHGPVYKSAGETTTIPT